MCLYMYKTELSVRSDWALFFLWDESIHRKQRWARPSNSSEVWLGSHAHVHTLAFLPFPFRTSAPVNNMVCGGILGSFQGYLTGISAITKSLVVTCNQTILNVSDFFSYWLQIFLGYFNITIFKNKKLNNCRSDLTDLVICTKNYWPVYMLGQHSR